MLYEDCDLDLRSFVFVSFLINGFLMSEALSLKSEMLSEADAPSLPVPADIFLRFFMNS